MVKSEALKEVTRLQKGIDKLVILAKSTPTKCNFAKLIMAIYCQNHYFKIAIEDQVDKDDLRKKLEEELTLNDNLIAALKLSMSLFK